MRPTNRSNIATRLKLAESSKVIAVVKSEGKLYSATKQIKVTIGGCGG
jgi:sulfur-oxidizing protein SoxY